MDDSNSTPVSPPIMEISEDQHHIDIISDVLITSESTNNQEILTETETTSSTETPEKAVIIDNVVICSGTSVPENVNEVADIVQSSESQIPINLEENTVNSELPDVQQIPPVHENEVVEAELSPEINNTIETVVVQPSPEIHQSMEIIEVEPVIEVMETVEAPDIPELVEPIPNITIQSKEDSSYTSQILKTLKTGGLGLLSAYDSADDSDASDSESVIEVPTTSAVYRNQVIEIDSDDSSSSDEDCDLQKKRNELEKMIQVDDDSEDEEGFKKQPPKVQGELLLDDLPPIEDLHITVPEQDCVDLGVVSSVIDQLLLVKTVHGAPLLDIGTVLFLDKGQKVLGEVFDVLGQVADPLYCVRFNTNNHIKEKEINLGDKVYCAPRTEHTQLIILSNLTKVRGSDASWEHDVEPPSKYVEFSDDEEEQAARRARRTKNRNEYRPSDENEIEVVDLTKKPRQQNANNRGRQPRQQGSQQYYQQMHQQQPFNYQTDANTWHSNFQSQFDGNPYAGQQGGNYSQGQGYSNHGNFQQNQGNGGYQRNFQRNRNYQPRNSQGFSQNNQSGGYEQQGGFPQNNPQGNQQYYQGQAPFYQQGGGGYQ